MRNLEGYPDPTAGRAMFERPVRSATTERPIRLKSIEAPKPQRKKPAKPKTEVKKIMYSATPAYTSKKYTV